MVATRPAGEPGATGTQSSVLVLAGLGRFSLCLEETFPPPVNKSCVITWSMGVVYGSTQIVSSVPIHQ